MILSDKFGRKFNYLRLSLTDVCNFSCQYCLPNGYCGVKAGRENFLTLDEINNLIVGLSLLGLKKVRLTGGEPTLRRDFLDIVKKISSIKTIETIAVTTNGYSFYRHAQDYYNAGITNVTISLDSLVENKFQTITQSPYYNKVIQSIDQAISLGFRSVKINVVLLKGLNDTSDEINHFFDYVKDKSVTIRFIEMMKTGDNQSDHEKYFSSTNIIKDKLRKEGWSHIKKEATSGPALEYNHNDYIGKIGIISPYSNIFCKDCNRIRVTSKGDLYVCLFDKCSSNLRDFLGHPNQREQLISRVVKAYTNKDISHFLHEGIIGGDKHFSSIGG